MKAIRCSQCGELVKTNAQAYITHCSVKQNITDDNWVNKSKFQTQNTKGEQREDNNGNAVGTNVVASQSHQTLQEQGLINPESSEDIIPKKNTYRGSVPMIEKDLDIQNAVTDEAELFNPAEVYDFKCECGVYFMKQTLKNNNYKCPSCGQDWSEVQTNE